MDKPRNKGGRPKGSPNKVTREIKAQAAQFTRKGIKQLAEIAFTKAGGDFKYDVEARTKAIGMLLDRGHGKPPTAITGSDGGPLVITSIERVIVKKGDA